MKIKQFIFDDLSEDTGIQAISLVEDPAIETNWIYFNKENFKRKKGEGTKVTEQPTEQPITDTMKLVHPVYGWNFWEYKTRNNEPRKIDTSHPFCIEHSKPGKIYHITDIRNFHNHATANKDEGWNINNDFTKDFKGMLEQDFNLDQQIYNCRHFLSPVRNVNKVPKYMLDKYYGSFKKDEKPSNKFSVNFKVENTEQRIISGVAMIPELLIYRRGNAYEDEYYGYFTKSDVQKLKERYGFNREITINHKDNITGNAILLDSWLYEKEGDDSCGVDNLTFGSWCVKYKILNERLWEYIKEEKIKGFSVEVIL